MIYFAYGSNLSPRQMASRCPGARPLAAGRVDGWRFRASTWGTANIVPERDGAVFGALWRVTPRHLKTLDLYEGVRVGNFRRAYVRAHLGDGTSVSAVTYLGSRRYPGIARVHYMETAVLAGARAFDLPPDYIAELESWLPRVRIGERRRHYVGRRR